MRKDFLKHEYSITDKTKAVDNEIMYMLNRTQQIFRYDGLPDTIPARELELFLQTKGAVFVTKYNDNLYAFIGNAGGELDEYYRPTKFIVSNPYLNLSKEYTIGVDGVLIRNDTMELGLIPLFKKYCVLLAENKISIRQAIINSRALSILTASDDKTKASADLFFKKLIDGELVAIGETPFLDGVKSFNVNTGSNNSVRMLIELEQYLKASMFNEIGLDANYNMKRDRISSAEAELNDDFLLPLIDEFMNCRREGFKEVNEMFDTNIEVEFYSTWLTNELENKKEQEIYQTDITVPASEVSTNVEEISVDGGSNYPDNEDEKDSDNDDEI